MSEHRKNQIWGMISRIDSLEKCAIAEDFIRKEKMSNSDFDEFMMAITFIYREISKH